jgi:gliding motility-associated-like protein
MIYQPQGARIDAATEQWGAFSDPNNSSWGAVLDYQESGNYEFAEVVSVGGTTTITISCGLKNNYDIAGHAQVIRVPRLNSLTVPNGTVLTGDPWTGSVGGLVVVEVIGATNIAGGGTITANNLGFRGGLCLDNNSVTGGSYFAANNDFEGAEKGESIAGYTTEYTAVTARYCMGAPANGGGGGTTHNSGGGGGANGGTGTWTGNGIPDPTYNNAWDEEIGLVISSSGGGRGGYSFSSFNVNANNVGPGDASWGGDNRRVRGGLGGRSMDYSSGKIFFGGGGGAGEQNNSNGGSGGRGGGIVYLLTYSNITGNGSITANGQNGTTSLPTPLASNSYSGKDGAGGAGGGGAIIINTTGTASGFSCTANGGTGGNQTFIHGALHFTAINDAYGPGGGGGGGYIAVSNGTPTRTTNGGNNGVTNSDGMTEFPPNGATRGTEGTNNAVIEDYSFTVSNDTICSGGSVTLTAIISGTVPSNTNLNWYTQQFGGVSVGTGNSFTTPVLAVTTTYYVGFCPGWYRIPVTVVVGSNPTIDITNINITDETCTGNDGGISGIVVSGGTGSLTYEWNGNSSVNQILSNASAGNYTLVVTDASGCSSSSGPHTIGSGGGPIINSTNMTISHTTCGNSNGSILGITTSGGTGALSFEWNGNSVGSEDISNLTSGTYTLTVTDGVGCSSSAGPFTINSSSNPVIDITGILITDATCGNNNGSITGITTTGGSGSNVITWNGNVNPDEDIFNLAGGNYTIVVTDGSSCSDTEGPFTINTLGSPVIDDSNIILTDATCSSPNGSIEGILVTGGTAPLEFDWNGATASSADTIGISGGMFTLTITDANGCTDVSGPYTINSSAGPTASAIGTNISCFGMNDGSAIASAIGGDGNYSFQWAGGPNTSSYTGLSAGTYTVMVTDGNGCQSGTVVTISEPSEIIGTVSGNTTICIGDNTTLTASGSSQFEWNTSETTASISVSPSDNTTYVVIISDGTCADTVSVDVIVNADPIASVTGDLSICQGESTTLTASGGSDYLWNTTDNTASITVNPTGNISYDVTVSNNCGSDNATVNVIVNSPPIVSASADVTINLGSSSTLVATGGTNYTWSPTTGLDCSSCASTNASPTATTEYIVYVTDANGCSNSDTVIVTIEEEFVIFIPDAFSPNGDGQNEMLFVRGAGIENFIFKLYDRWGQMVFETNDQNNGWDGTFKGTALNEGVFVYILEGNYFGGEEFSQNGNITLHK